MAFRELDAFTRQQVEMFDESAIAPVPRLFKSFFGRAANGGKIHYQPNGLIAEIEIQNATRGISLAVERGKYASYRKEVPETQLENWASVQREFPLLYEQSSITKEKLWKRLMGEPEVNSPFSPMDRARINAQKLFRLHTQKILRTHELLASQSVLTGKMAQIIGTSETDKIYDFRRDAALAVAVTTSWLDSTNATPLDDIENVDRALMQVANYRASAALWSSDVIAAFLNSDQVKNFSDKNLWGFVLAGNYAQGVPSGFQWMIDAGADMVGVVICKNGRRIPIFTYDAVYDTFDDEGVKTVNKYLPDETALFFDDRGRCDQWYGPSETMPMTSVDRAWFAETFGVDMSITSVSSGMREGGNVTIRPELELFFDAYRTEDRSAYVLRTQSAPLFVPVAANAFATLTGVVAEL